MRIEYKLKLKEALPAPKTLEEGSCLIDDITLSWKIKRCQSEHCKQSEFCNLSKPTKQSEPCKLLEFSVSINKVEIDLDNKEEIVPKDAINEKIKQIKQVAKYFSNRLLFQTNQDAIDIESSFTGSPCIYPETVEEELEFKKRVQRVFSCLSLSFRHTNDFEPSDYPDGFINKQAFSDYADGLRVRQKNAKCILFYRIVEYFFSINPKQPQKEKKQSQKKKENKGKKGQRSITISEHVSKFDESYTREKLDDLKLLRNDAAHVHSPSAKNSTIDELERLARLLLKHPPKS